MAINRDAMKEQKLIALAAMAAAMLAAWLWGRWCARVSLRRGWDAGKAGRVALAGAWAPAAGLPFRSWSLSAASLFLLMGLARRSCSRALRPGERFADLEEQYPVFDRRPVSLNLRGQDPSPPMR
jgi:hypothetical protein